MKEKLLDILAGRRGEFVSGQELADRLEVSRAAVWKGINALRREGIPVEASTNRGYCLPASADVLSAGELTRLLGRDAGRLTVRTFRSLPSTNREVKSAAAAGAPEGLVVLAERQTGGYGRRGRAFFSPDTTGLYMSLLLRPSLPAPASLLITTAAAVAAAEAVEELGGAPAGIKWVNDVIVGGRKVCGILTEAALSLESGSLDYAVLGIGVNLTSPAGGFPRELAGIAGAISDRPIPNGRCRLAASILRRFLPLYDHLSDASFFEAYRSRLTLLGKRITVLRGEEEREAEAIGLERDFRLLVRYSDGSTEALSSGEVSTRTEN